MRLKDQTLNVKETEIALQSFLKQENKLKFLTSFASKLTYTKAFINSNRLNLSAICLNENLIYKEVYHWFIGKICNAQNN